MGSACADQEVVLAIATGFDEPRHSQEREVMADRGLALLEPQRAVTCSWPLCIRYIRMCKRVSSESSLKTCTRSFSS